MKKENFRVKTRNNIHKMNTSRLKQTATLTSKKIKFMAKPLKEIKKM